MILENMAEEEDHVVQEVDVFLSKQLLKQLYLFQYPVRPNEKTYDDAQYLSARVKPVQQKVELELSLNTNTSNYDRNKGEQIALNVDGNNSEDSYFHSSLMDKQVLMSTHLGSCSKNCYAIGSLQKDGLHLTPLHGMLQLRPSFNYLDHSDSKQKQMNKETGEEESSHDEAEEEPTTVKVKFARPESDRAKKARERSFMFLKQKMDEEPWTQVAVNTYQSEASNMEKQRLLCPNTEEKVSDLHILSQEYLKMLIPDHKATDFSKPSLPNSMTSMAHLRTLPLGDQINSLMLSAKVLQFSQLLSLLSAKIDAMAALRALQQVAVLVQGCWVVKSEILYPPDSISPHSGVCAETLIRARDYVMWRFTQSRSVIRKEITAAIKIPPEDITEILDQMARQRMTKGWEFLLPCDYDFLQRYPEVVERQKMLWDGRCQQFAKTIKMPKTGALDKGGAENKANVSPPKIRQRRRTKSQRDSFGSDSDQMPPESSKQLNVNENLPANSIEPSVRIKPEVLSPSRMNMLECGQGENVKVKSEPMDVSDPYNGSNADGDDFTPSPELFRELTVFVQERLRSRFCTPISELRRAVALKLAESPPGHLFSRGVSDRLLEKACKASGAQQVHVQWPNGAVPEQMFAMIEMGDSYDTWREALIKIYKTGSKFRKGTIKKKIEEEIGIAVPEEDFKKFMQDCCVSGKNGFYLKGMLKMLPVGS